MARETSLAVYHSIVEKMAPGLRRRVCEILLVHNGCLTSSEIASRLNRPRDSISPRMKELIDRDLIEERAVRSCSVTGHEKITYFLSGREER